MELAKLGMAIREGEIMGRKFYNKGKFERAKKVWAKASSLRKKFNSLRYELQIRL